MSSLVECKLGFLDDPQGSVFVKKTITKPVDPSDWQQLDKNVSAYVISVVGPHALESSRHENYSQATLKISFNSYNTPPSQKESEISHKIRLIFSQVLMLEEFPRTGIYIGIQPASDIPNLELLINATTLAFMDAALPMKFMPVAISKEDNSLLVVNAYTGEIIYFEVSGLVQPLESPMHLEGQDRALVDQNYKWLIDQFSLKIHSRPI
jgi:ribonuclease PH